MHMMKEKTAIVLLSLGAAWGNSVSASEVGALTTFSSGTTAVAAEVNGNFNTVATAVDDNDTRITAVESQLAEKVTTGISENASSITTLQSDMASKQALITGTCADGSSIRAIKADGTVVCELDDAQNGSVSFSSMSMQVNATDLCVLRKNVTGGYVSFGTASTWNSCDMVSGIQLPDQAMPMALHCRVWDNNGTADSPTVKLYRADNTGSASELMYETPMVTDVAGVQYVTSSTNLTNGVIDNSIYNYYMLFDAGGIDTISVGTDLRFYNCSVDYAYNYIK